eukprot:1991610-Prymnesium_polylepis.1
MAPTCVLLQVQDQRPTSTAKTSVITQVLSGRARSWGATERTAPHTAGMRMARAAQRFLSLSLSLRH